MRGRIAHYQIRGSGNCHIGNNDTIVHASRYNYPNKDDGVNIHLTSVNVIAYRPPIEIFQISDLDKYALNAHLQV